VAQALSPLWPGPAGPAVAAAGRTDKGVSAAGQVGSLASGVGATAWQRRAVPGCTRRGQAALGRAPPRGRKQLARRLLAQVCSVYTWQELPPSLLLAAVNGSVAARAGQLRAWHVASQPRAFHAQFSARWRRYVYILPLRPLSPPLQAAAAGRAAGERQRAVRRSPGLWAPLVALHPYAAGCWLLAAGCWLLAAGCWLLAAGCWLLTQHVKPPPRLQWTTHCFARPWAPSCSTCAAWTTRQSTRLRWTQLWWGLQELSWAVCVSVCVCLWVGGCRGGRLEGGGQVTQRCCCCWDPQHSPRSLPSFSSSPA
jgi:tRNA U38,U39,U40 pseudouridine synthase TruA